jgi:nicotinamide mononucleotide transporter
MTLQNLFDVNTTFFTFLNYPMSYLEFFGTIFTGWSVFLAAKNKVINWPIGLVGIILYGFLFYQIHLYSDLLEQVYYFITTFWGWYLWSSLKKDEQGKSEELQVTHFNLKQNILVVALIFILTQGLSIFMSNIHLILPVFFPVPASYTWIDSFTTIISFVATVYLAKRKIENWILVDIIGIWLYYQKGVAFLSLLYLAFLINAFFGLAKWNKLMVKSEKI